MLLVSLASKIRYKVSSEKEMVRNLFKTLFTKKMAVKVAAVRDKSDGGACLG